MSKKKGKKKNQGPPKPSVRLSQCMIVKNEEKNIEKALGWAKGIAFEQIVVDTGSTDRTVELAGKMGAKVYHFEWINDFSAAKNFAIEQATGNWIAFLDADEYLSPDDAKKLIPLLKRIQAEPEMRKWLALNFPMAHVDENGKPFAIHDQERVFRNVPAARYTGKIHEMLAVPAENIAHDDEVTVIHTGYAKATYEEANKAERNIDLLRAELATNPDDLNTKAYLADSLMAKDDEESIAEAEELLYEVILGKTGVIPALRKKGYSRLVKKYDELPKKRYMRDELCRKALSEFPEDLDFECYLGIALNQKGEYRSALEVLRGCEAKLSDPSYADESDTVAADPALLFTQMVIASQVLNEMEDVVRYATMILSTDKSRTEILSHYIGTLLKHGVPDDEVLGLLAKLYDLNNPKDLLLIARAAKDCGALDFARMIIGMATDR